MGLIQKIFGSIAAFFGSLFGVLGKVFGLKKSGYFLELDEDNSGSAPQPQKSAPQPQKQAASQPQSASQKQPKAEPTPLEAKGVEVFPAKAEVATEAALKSEQTDEVSPEQLDKKSKQSASTSQDLAPAGALPVAAAEAKGNSSHSSAPEKTFATDYLVTPEVSGGRRRPGPSLSPFKQMAKTVKAPAR
ncbi:hypothetical protein [Sphaerothrix gracilis]|uniref:hypothetical protein n=1 Tax=Sphaerothrix gracilis TaxID=3151835 RepID=UPI0031FDD69B